MRFSTLFCRLLNMFQDRNQYISDNAQQKIYFRLFFKSLEQKFEHLELKFDEVNERIDKD